MFVIMHRLLNHQYFSADRISTAPPSRSDGHPFVVIGLTIAGGKIVEMNILADPERLSRDFSAVEPG